MDTFLPKFEPVEPRDRPVTSDLPEQSLSDELSPALLGQLQTYVENTVVSSVAQAITTVIPDVVEAALAKQQQSAQFTQSQCNDDSDYMPGRYQGQRPIEARQDLVAWVATGGIVAVMAGAVAYSLSLSAPVQTQQQNRQLTDQLTQQSQQLLESSQQVLNSKQRCGNFSIICTIKE